MRIRQIKPEFWNDARLEGIGLDVRLLYIGLWQEADDTGWLRWDVDQIYLDLLRSELDRESGLALIKRARTVLVRRKRLRVLRCGHAIIPKLTNNQWKPGPGKAVETIAREHAAGCSGVPRGEAAGSPTGKVGLGKVSEVKNAHAHESDNGAAENRGILHDPTASLLARRAAFKTLDRLGATTPQDHDVWSTVLP